MAASLPGESLELLYLGLGLVQAAELDERAGNDGDDQDDAGAQPPRSLES